ncbi:MAG: hypothetical protein ACJ0DD_02870 [Paracoccaceae bacterium]
MVIGWEKSRSIASSYLPLSRRSTAFSNISSSVWLPSTWVTFANLLSI